MCDHAKGRCVLHPAGCIPTHALCSEVCPFGNVTAQKRKHSNNDSNPALTGAAATSSGERERGAVNIANKTAVK